MWLTAVASLALWLLGMTPVYGLTALAAGAAFIVEAHRLHRAGGQRPMRLFHWSNTYLAIGFLAVAVDALLAEASGESTHSCRLSGVLQVTSIT